MHIVTIAKDGNGRYRSPTVSRPYLAIVVRRLRSRHVRESERRLPSTVPRGACSRLGAIGVHVDYERAESTC